MASSSKKRERPSDHSDQGSEAVAKRPRRPTEEQLVLSKLFEGLATDSDDSRIDAAKSIIARFSPENGPDAKQVEDVLVRLIKGLCSQRKAARVGFSLTLTELLRAIFGQKKHRIDGLSLDVGSVIDLIEDKTRAKGNISGRERRDHLLGSLFAYKAVLQSSIITQPTLSIESWEKVINHVFDIARDVPWLREECGLVLVEAAKSLGVSTQYTTCAKEIMERLHSHKLTYTAEGVAIWLTLRKTHDQILPEGVWHKKDPLCKKERVRLARLLKENYHVATQDGKGESVKSASANPNPVFTWDLVLSDILQRDEQKSRADKDQKSEFSQFWIDTVDNNLFTTGASHERKAWGFKLLSNMVMRAPCWALPSLFSPNLMRTLINQSKKDDRFLHNAARAALGGIQTRVQNEGPAGLGIFKALTTQHGSIDFDKATKTKTLENIMIAVDDGTLKKIVRELNHVILCPGARDQTDADQSRQVVADLLMTVIKNYKHYNAFAEQESVQDSWLHKALEVMVEHTYFEARVGTKTNRVATPPISPRTRTIFQERLSSSLTKLLTVEMRSRSIFAMMLISLIRAKSGSSKTALVLKIDAPVMERIEAGLQTVDAIAAKGSIAGNESAAEGFLLMYCLTLLQIYNGEGDAVLLLDDLDAFRKSMVSKGHTTSSGETNGFVEIILSFIGNDRLLFRRIGEEAFSIFSNDIQAAEVVSLGNILDMEENIEGQNQLFNHDDDEVEEEEEEEEEEQDSMHGIGRGIDVEMMDGNASTSSGTSTTSDEGELASDDDSSENDAELTQFNNLLAMTLQTSKPLQEGDSPESSEEESDMDDEQMMALDPHLSKIFQERSKIASKKKQRKDAKQNVVQFKIRVLDLAAIYLDKQYSNILSLQLLLPVIRRTRASANKQVSEKATKTLKTFFDTRSKHKAPLPVPDENKSALHILRLIHEEAALGGGAKAHADACASASLHCAKVLVGADKEAYAKVVDVYAETQKRWFADRKSLLQPALFTQFHNWSVNTRQQGR